MDETPEEIFSLSIFVGFIVAALVASLWAYSTVGHIFAKESVDSHRWHQVEATLSQLGAWHGASQPDYQDGAVTFALNGEQASRPVQLVNQWHLGDKLTVWVSQAGRVVIPADRHTYQEDPTPEAVGKVAGTVIWAIVVWIFLWLFTAFGLFIAIDEIYTRYRNRPKDPQLAGWM